MLHKDIPLIKSFAYFRKPTWPRTSDLELLWMSTSALFKMHLKILCSRQGLADFGSLQACGWAQQGEATHKPGPRITQTLPAPWCWSQGIRLKSMNQKEKQLRSIQVGQQNWPPAESANGAVSVILIMLKTAIINPPDYNIPRSIYLPSSPHTCNFLFTSSNSHFICGNCISP